MRLTILAVGKLRRGTERDLFEHYAGLVGWDLTMKEVEETRPFPAKELKMREAELLRRACPDGAAIVAMDERGKQMGSRDFAASLGRWQDEAVRDVVFMIGGADGLDQTILAEAVLTLSLGKMTWPHLLVRGLLAEQIYRGQQILAGHPYHR